MRASRAGVRSLGACAMVLMLAPHAAAQVRPAPRVAPGPTPRAGTWEIGGSVAWAGGYDLGEQNAELTRNIGGAGERLTLFSTSSEIAGFPGVQGRLGVYLSRSLLVEGGVRYGRPVFSTRISGDTEGGPPVTAETTIAQYVIDGTAVWHFRNASFAGGKGVPFVSGGAGYLRELFEGNELVETGTEYHAGAGLKYWFGTARRRFGVRGEAGVSIRDGGFDFEDRLRTVPVAAVSVVYIF